LAEPIHTHVTFQNELALEALRRYEEIFDGAFTIDELVSLRLATSSGALRNSITANCRQGRTVPARQTARRALGSDSGQEVVRALG
jgi:hypothetical protein